MRSSSVSKWLKFEFLPPLNGEHFKETGVAAELLGITVMNVIIASFCALNLLF